MSTKIKEPFGSSPEEKVHVQGAPWTTVSVHNTYEEANKKILEVIANEPTYATKIRRISGDRFKLIKRINPELAKVEEEMQKRKETVKKKKKRAVKKKSS